MLYYAEIEEFTGSLDYEIEKVELLKNLPERWTYPEIQPKLVKRVMQ